MRRLIQTIGVLMAVLLAGLAKAAPVQWSGNGHFYEAVSATEISWGAAKLAAEAAGGHLATFTSAAENAFVAELLRDFGNISVHPYWLGGYQPAGSLEPDGGWAWVTGEAWAYTNWAGGEPNNGIVGGDEGALAYAEVTGGDTWNDLPAAFTGWGVLGGYVIEYVPEPGTPALALLALGIAGLSRRKAS